jgi:hypothetical protein
MEGGGLDLTVVSRSTEEYHRMPQQGQPVSRQRFEISTTRIQAWSFTTTRTSSMKRRQEIWCYVLQIPVLPSTLRNLMVAGITTEHYTVQGKQVLYVLPRNRCLKKTCKSWFELAGLIQVVEGKWTSHCVTLQIVLSFMKTLRKRNNIGNMLTFRK